MGIYNIHAGHGPSGGTGCGAVGILDESKENRIVKSTLVDLLKKYGHTVYDCTCEENKSAASILTTIVDKCNAHNVDLDISIHLNSGRGDKTGDSKTGGVEVYGYNNDVADIANKICQNISSSLGVTNRGFKTNQDLYILKHTRAKAVLIECVFVDDKDDADRWNATKCASAIFTALTGQTVEVVNTSTNKNQTKLQLCTVNGKSSQRWKVHHNSDGTVSLESVVCGLFLDVNGGINKNGTTVGIYKKGNGKNQKWILKRQAGDYNPTYLRPILLTTAIDTSRCLNVANAKKINIYKRNKAAAQQWSILDLGDGTWIIINISSCKALDVDCGGK